MRVLKALSACVAFCNFRGWQSQCDPQPPEVILAPPAGSPGPREPARLKRSPTSALPGCYPTFGPSSFSVKYTVRSRSSGQGDAKTCQITFRARTSNGRGRRLKERGGPWTVHLNCSLHGGAALAALLACTPKGTGPRFGTSPNAWQTKPGAARARAPARDLALGGPPDPGRERAWAGTLGSSAPAAGQAPGGGSACRVGEPRGPRRPSPGRTPGAASVCVEAALRTSSFFRHGQPSAPYLRDR